MTRFKGRRFLTGLCVLCAAAAIARASAVQVTYTNLHTFTNEGPGGSELTAGVILDQAGNLYGTAYDGGESREGAVFKLTKGTDGRWRETVLHSFGRDGSWGPVGNLVFDPAGNLYGVTTAGGYKGQGTIFELSPGPDGTWAEKRLYSFCSSDNCADGARPGSGLTLDQAGNLYGTTFSGGSLPCPGGCGTVYKLAQTERGYWKESVLYSFCPQAPCVDGERAYASVIFDNTGNLYGTTEFGGNVAQCNGFGGCDIVFELKPSPDGPWIETILYDFCSTSDCKDGTLPVDSLVFDTEGNIYGTASGGGTMGAGTVFELLQSQNGGWTEKVLHSFKGTDGAAPYGSLIFDPSGNLYGTTFEGGPGEGVAFALVPRPDGSWDDLILHNFYDNPGAILPGGLVMDSQGNLYGATEGDSNRTFGSVFELTP